VLRGDDVRPEPAVERAGKPAGAIVRPSDATDFVTLGLGVFMGRLLGVVIAIPVGVTHISLSTSLGTLLMGLLVGWLRSVRPSSAASPTGRSRL